MFLTSMDLDDFRFAICRLQEKAYFLLIHSH